MKKFKVIIFLVLIISVCSIAYINYAKEFSDLPQTHWAYKYISELSDRGVINGYEDGSYKPSGTITRAEFLKLIVCEYYNNVYGFQEILDYSPNLGGKWYDLYVELSKDSIPYSYSGDELNQPISRMEVANIIDSYARLSYLYKESSSKMTLEEINVQNQAIRQALYEMGYTKKTDMSEQELQKIIKKVPASKNEEFHNRIKEIYMQNISETPSYSEIVKTFDDLKDYNESSRLAVSNVARLGLIIGYEDGTFRPEKNMTRAEVATVIHRFAEQRGEK